MTQEEYMQQAPTFAIYDGLCKAQSMLTQHQNVTVSVSGGSDSDNMIDVIEHMRVRDSDHHMFYYFIDTGIEMAATKRQLDYLEKRYGIEIHRVRAQTPVPVAVKKGGYPFISKTTAHHIYIYCVTMILTSIRIIVRHLLHILQSPVL